MAVLTTFKVKGDPDELIGFKKEQLDPIFEPAARANGVIEHIACRADDGIVIVNIWETLEGSERTAEEVRPKLQEAAGENAPQQSDWQSYEIVQRVVA